MQNVAKGTGSRYRRAMWIVAVAVLAIWASRLAMVQLATAYPPDTIDDLVRRGCDNIPSQRVVLLHEGRRSGFACGEAEALVRGGGIAWASAVVIVSRAPTLVFETTVSCEIHALPTHAKRCMQSTNAW